MANLIDFLRSLNTFQKTALAFVLCVIVVYTVYQKYTVHYPTNLPRVRENGRTSFSLKTRLAYYTDCESLFKEAYETYSKQGKSCLIPGIGFRDEIILPAKSLKWMVSQPDSILSVYDAFVEVDQIHYNLGSDIYVRDGWQGLLVRTELNLVLENICAALNNELGVAFDTRFGTDENEFKELNVFRTMKMIVAQGSSRFTVGLPLCRNEEYLMASSAFTDQFVMTAGITSAMPKVLRPFVGTLAYIPQYLNVRTIKKHFAPLLAERIALCKTTEKLSPSEPRDHLQMMIRYAISERPEELSSLKHMTARLAVANLGSFHQTTIAITNMIFNILASDAEYNTIATLREEINSVIGEKGEWTKAAVAKMVKCDSVCKETLRINSFGNRSPIRKVAADNVRSEDGILLPKGAMVSLLLAVQVDEENFPDALKFIPFRFSDMREKGEGTAANFVSLGEKFLPFGYGRHACPGRFLLEFELKMILSYMLTNYDIELAPEHKGTRPESKWVAEAIMPPLSGKIRVKRRRT